MTSAVPSLFGGGRSRLEFEGLVESRRVYLVLLCLEPVVRVCLCQRLWRMMLLWGDGIRDPCSGEKKARKRGRNVAPAMAIIPRPASTTEQIAGGELVDD